MFSSNNVNIFWNIELTHVNVMLSKGNVMIKMYVTGRCNKYEPLQVHVSSHVSITTAVCLDQGRKHVNLTLNCVCVLHHIKILDPTQTQLPFY